MGRAFKLDPVRKIESYAVIIRAIHERGTVQKEALVELARRGLWLAPDQRKQAGLGPGRMIRHCEGNKAAWCLVRLRDDGSEYEGGLIPETAMSVDRLLAKLEPGEEVIVRA